MSPIFLNIPSPELPSFGFGKKIFRINSAISENAIRIALH